MAISLPYYDNLGFKLAANPHMDLIPIGHHGYFQHSNDSILLPPLRMRMQLRRSLKACVDVAGLSDAVYIFKYIGPYCCWLVGQYIFCWIANTKCIILLIIL